MECEELGCVVGGPFKPNKLREVRGLVWRPWINKPSKMTMRCADICHHTTPASKHKLPKPSLPPSLLHVLCPIWSLSLHPLSPSLDLLPSSILSTLHSFLCLFFSSTPSSSPPFQLLLYSCSSSYPPQISIPPFHLSPVAPSIHPFIRACMAGCLSRVLYVL